MQIRLGKDCPQRSPLFISFPIRFGGGGTSSPPSLAQPAPSLAGSSRPVPPILHFPPWQGVIESRQDQVPRLPVQKSRQGSPRAQENPKWREGKKESTESSIQKWGRAQPPRQEQQQQYLESAAETSPRSVQQRQPASQQGHLQTKVSARHPVDFSRGSLVECAYPQSSLPGSLQDIEGWS